MTYGQRPEGMDDGQWLIECQCRHVAREAMVARDRTERAAIFEQWKRITPGITKERVAQIWREGVPMPARDKQAAKGAAQ